MPFIATNPATGEVIREFAGHTPEQVEAKLAAATQAFAAWKKVPYDERARLLRAAADVLEADLDDAALLLTTEMGKTLAAAKGEVLKCAMNLRYYAEHAPAALAPQMIPTSGARSGVRFEPLGPLFAIMPWNYPYWQFIRVLAPALMLGNPLVLKHASNVPGSAHYMEELFAKAGFPEGLVTNLFIDHAQAAQVIADPRIAAVTLTGSEYAGRKIAETAGYHLKKVVLELGGADPFIVTSAADMDKIIPLAVTGRFQNNGQSCIAAKRFIVVKDRAEEFMTKFTAAVAAIPTGDPLDPTTVLGPVVSRSALEEIEAQVQDSVDRGARVLTGGHRLEGPGFFYAATVLTDVPADSRAAQEELFGPVAVVTVVDDLDEAIAFANSIRWGLGAVICSEDAADIDHAIAHLESGMVFANAFVASMPELPFGGVKESGHGRELSTIGLTEFANVKSFYVAK